MKKVLVSLISIMLLLSFFISIFIYSFFSTAYMISDRKSDDVVINIEIGADKVNDIDNMIVLSKGMFYDELKDAADKAQTNIYKVTYPVCNIKEKKKIVIYAYVNDEKEFYKNVSLKGGRLLNKEDAIDTYMTTEKNSDTNCIGQIKNFDKSIILEIRPLESNKNDLMYGKYIVNRSKLDQFKKALSQEKVCLAAKQLSVSTALNPLMNESDLANFYTVSLLCGLSLVIIFISILISYAYIVVYCYKQYALKKLFGSGNLKLILKQFKEMVLLYLAIEFISCTGLIAFLYFYNNWAQLKFFMYVIFLVHATIFLLFCLSILILSLAIYFIDIKLMIKNKKPLLTLAIINDITKFIFSATIFLLVVLLLNNLIKVKNQVDKLERWDFTKNYAFAYFDFGSDKIHNENDFWNSVDVFRGKAYKLHQLMKENNNLLMRPTNALISQESKMYYMQDHRKPWAPEMNSVDINNNYLKQNPIYDENGKRIDLSEYENKFVMTILVPEKYKRVEKEVIDSYQKYCDFRSEFTAQKLSLQLIYVKDNQKYFSMNPLLAADKNFEYVDPIAIVINNCSIAPDSASAYMTQGYYYFHIDNPNDPYESMNETIKKLGMENNFITIASLYNFVEQKFYSTAQLMNIYFILAVICTVPYVVSLLATITNYIERKKQILAVKYINGCSFFKLHYKLFLGTIFTWAIIFCIVTFVCCRLNFFNIDSTIVFAIGFLLSLTDLLLEYFVLKMASLKKVKDLIKGI